ncbi:MAG: Fpg/Nei family DNA glycosylase [Spirochaetia bacterium]
MPELPDVEIFRKYWEKTSQNKKITDIEYGADRVIRSSRSVISRYFKGTEFAANLRVGKHLFVQNDRQKWLRFHFGMTGYFDSGKKDDDFEYGQLIFTFSGGTKTAYINKRKLGNVMIVDSPDKYLQEQNLGPDAMETDPGTFGDLISGRTGSLKGTLMNQNVISGLGNVYTDEILYQAGLHPEKPADELTEKELRDLHAVMSRVLKTAIRNGADPGSFPGTYLTAHRNEGDPCPKCGGGIRKIKVSGRSTYFCPKCQKK